MDKADLALLRRRSTLDRVKKLLNEESDKNTPHKAFGWIVNFLVFRSELHGLKEFEPPY